MNPQNRRYPSKRLTEVGGPQISQLCRLTIEDADDTVVARLVGEIDMSNAEELGAAVPPRVSNNARALIADLSGVRYIDSSGLSMLFELQRRLRSRGQVLRLVVPPEATIRRTLELVGFDASANVDGSLEAARGALGD
jgi:anti-anti-sigma factor